MGDSGTLPGLKWRTKEFGAERSDRAGGCVFWLALAALCVSESREILAIGHLRQRRCAASGDMNTQEEIHY
jgi:hypothetical protein